MTKVCDFCDNPNAECPLPYNAANLPADYHICTSCRKRDIDSIMKVLLSSLKDMPGYVGEIKLDEKRKAVVFDLATGKSRPRFLNPEDLT